MEGIHRANGLVNEANPRVILCLISQVIQRRARLFLMFEINGDFWKTMINGAWILLLTKGLSSKRLVEKMKIRLTIHLNSPKES